MGVLRAKVGGSWVDIGAVGTDEVQVGGTTPVDAAVELWYDTAAVPAVDPAKMPRGIVAMGTMLGTGVAAPAGGAAVNLSQGLAFTPTVGRRYRVAIFIRATQAASSQQGSLLVNGIGGFSAFIAVNSFFANAILDIIWTPGAATPVTLTAQGSCNIAATFYTDATSCFYVEDVGGV